MVVSQFTLLASTKKGNRPSYIRAAGHEVAVPMYEDFCRRFSEEVGRQVATGVFGADMQVELVNDGPVTICMDTKKQGIEIMTIKEAQEQVDAWIKSVGVRYFSELTNMAILTEEVGEVARIIARRLWRTVVQARGRTERPVGRTLRRLLGCCSAWPIRRGSI